MGGPVNRVLSSLDNQCFQEQINRLLKEIEDLQAKLDKPQIITLIGLDYIKLNCPVQEYKDKIDTLFFTADIPLYWILNVDIKISSTKTVTADITLINYYVKEKVKEKLQNFFLNCYNK